jgi:hypothetical protein
VDTHFRRGPCSAVNGPALLPCPAHDGRNR